MTPKIFLLKTNKLSMGFLVSSPNQNLGPSNWQKRVIFFLETLTAKCLNQSDKIETLVPKYISGENTDVIHNLSFFFSLQRSEAEINLSKAPDVIGNTTLFDNN